VEVLQRKADLGSIELSALRAELASLNVQHQVTTTDVLHDEVHTGLGLETSVQTQKERMPLLVRDQEDSLL